MSSPARFGRIHTRKVGQEMSDLGPTTTLELVVVLDRLQCEIAAELEARCGWDQVDIRSLNDAPLIAQGLVVTKGTIETHDCSP